MQEPNSSWWQATFPAKNGWCAYEPGRATLKQTDRETIHLAWAPHSHRKLISDDTQTISGCGSPVPSTVGEHWTARPVAAPAVQSIPLDPRHVPSSAAFRAAARAVCTRVNARVAVLAARIGAARRTLRSTASRGAQAAAEDALARNLALLMPLAREDYAQVPQPPVGGLDRLWQLDIGEQRLQLAPAAAAMSALEATATDAGQYLRSGDAIALQKSISEATLFSEDLKSPQGPAARLSASIERTMRLPSICTNPPAASTIFKLPTVS
jgi:hypothetical protein